MLNIEIKAKCNNLELTKTLVEKLKTQDLGLLHQIDTYFETKQGRLKLREINSTEAQLIPYYKEYSLGPMESNYSLLPVKNPQETKEILGKILGTLTVVDKKREAFLIENVRIHLDNVKNLGMFIELEAVYEHDKEKEEQILKVHSLLSELQVQKHDLLDRSYVDYLLIKDHYFLNLEVLYSFENCDYIISEFKRLDIDNNSPPDKRFFWLLFSKLNQEIKKLEFVSMSKTNDFESRVFNQGELKFNQVKARYNQHTLYNQRILNPDFIKVVNSYFLSLG